MPTLYEGQPLTQKQRLQEEAGQIITPDSLTPVKPLDVGTVATPNTATANGAVAGATQSAQSAVDALTNAKQPIGEAGQQENILRQRVNELIPEVYGGRAQAQAEAETTAGVTDIENQQNELNKQILSEAAKYNTAQADYEKQYADIYAQTGLTKARMANAVSPTQRRQLAEQNANAANIGLLEARKAGLAGDLVQAQKKADQAVNLKYAAVEEEYNIKTKQLENLSKAVEREEVYLTKQQEEQLAQAKQKVADEKAATAQKKADQKDAINFAYANDIKQPFYSIGGNVFNSLDGTFYENMTDAIRAGVKADGSNIQVVEKPAEKLDTSVVEVGGRKQLINNQTGQVIKDLGIATASGPSLFTKSELAQMSAGGLDEETANDIYSLIQQGASLDVIRDGLKKIDKNPVVLDVFDRIMPIHKILGQEKPEETQSKEEIVNDMKMIFTDEELKDIAKDLGYASAWHGQQWEIQNMFNKATDEELKRAITNYAK